MNRKNTKQIWLGGLAIGGGAPIRIQSMTNTDTRDAHATLAQIRRLALAGCELVRVAIPDRQALEAFTRLIALSPLPLVGDIHFDWRMAVGACRAGAAGIRINPGNIGSAEKIDKIIAAARESESAIRIGVNSGSLEKDLLQKYVHPTPEALAESAFRHARYMEEKNFTNFKISIKSSSVNDTVQACRRLAALCDWPQHIGITEAGPASSGAIRSAVGLGILLNEGIGDTIRVSLTADPVEEIRVAKDILRAIYPGQYGPELISCPTCGRTGFDLQSLASAVEERLAHISVPIKVAVMGCVVNGPGEAREADIGIAGGRDGGVVFRKGQPVCTVHGQENILPVFMAELDKLLREREES